MLSTLPCCNHGRARKIILCSVLFANLVADASNESQCEAENSSWPSVAVIIPTFNRYTSLSRAIRSVQQQVGYPPSLLHTYIVDDASTDPRYRDVHSTETVTWLRKRRSTRNLLGHPSAAHVRNVGINATTAEIICLLDDDDEYLADKLKTQIAAMRDGGCSFSASDGTTSCPT